METILNLELHWTAAVGLGGLALNAFVILSRSFIKQKFFSKLSEKSTFRILCIFLLSVWTVTVYSLNIYLTLAKKSKVENQAEETYENAIDTINSSMRLDSTQLQLLLNAINSEKKRLQSINILQLGISNTQKENYIEIYQKVDNLALQLKQAVSSKTVSKANDQSQNKTGAKEKVEKKALSILDSLENSNYDTLTQKFRKLLSATGRSSYDIKLDSLIALQVFNDPCTYVQEMPIRNDSSIKSGLQCSKASNREFRTLKEFLYTTKGYGRTIIENHSNKPSWLAPFSTVFYYDKENLWLAYSLACQLENLTGETFAVSVGAGNAVKNTRDELYVHYIK